MTARQVKGQRSKGKSRVKGPGPGQRCRVKVKGAGQRSGQGCVMLRQGQRYQVVDWRRSGAGRKSCERTPLSAACPRPSQPPQIPACPEPSSSWPRLPPSRQSATRAREPAPDYVRWRVGSAAPRRRRHSYSSFPMGRARGVSGALRRTSLPSWPMRARAVPSPHSNTRTASRDRRSRLVGSRGNPDV